MKTGLRTTKFRLNYPLQDWHYPKHLKNIAQLAKIKRPTIKANFKGRLPTRKNQDTPLDGHKEMILSLIMPIQV